MDRPTALNLPQPLVITIGNLKGGVGKTTTTWFLACYFARRGLRVLMIDADPLSQTGYKWHRKLRRLDVPVPFKLIPFPSSHVDDCIQDNADSGEVDVILVDTGGENDKIFAASVRRSHELLIVAAPNEGETERIPSSYAAAAATAADSPQEIHVRVLLTKVPPPRSKEGHQYRGELAEAGYEVMDSQATNWKWYRQAIGSTKPLDDLAEYEDVGAELVADYEVATV